MNIDAFDAQGHPVKYQVTAGPLGSPPSAGGAGGGSGGASGGGGGRNDGGGNGGGGGGGSGGGQDQQDHGIINLPPPSGGTAATIVVLDPDEETGWSGSDLYVNSRLFADLAPGARRDVMVWNVENVKSGQVTLDLTEGMAGNPYHNMMFVIGMEMPEPQ